MHFYKTVPSHLSHALSAKLLMHPAVHLIFNCNVEQSCGFGLQTEIFYLFNWRSNPQPVDFTVTLCAPAPRLASRLI